MATGRTRWVDRPVGGLRSRVSAGSPSGIDVDAEPRGRSASDPPLDDVDRQLGEYVTGRRVDVDLPVAGDGTGFRRTAWRELCRIPFGGTVGYGEIAGAAGSVLDGGQRPAIARAKTSKVSSGFSTR